MKYMRWIETIAAFVVGGMVVVASLWPAPLVLSEQLRIVWMTLTVALSVVASICAIRQIRDSRRRTSGWELIGHGLILVGIALLILVILVSLTSTTLAPGWPLTLALIATWMSAAALLGGALIGVLGGVR